LRFDGDHTTVLEKYIGRGEDARMTCSSTTLSRKPHWIFQTWPANKGRTGLHNEKNTGRRDACIDLENENNVS
jgi:hypothetical protein